jgi:predicted O-methyltransferase YrrM
MSEDAASRREAPRRAGAPIKQAVWKAMPESLRRSVFRRSLRQLSGDISRNRRMFDYDRRLLANPYLADVDATARDPESAFEGTGMSIGYPAWNLLYYSLLCSLPAREPVVIETGTNLGFSTIVLAQALADAGRGGTVRTVDIDPDAIAKARDHVDRAGLSAHVEFVTGDSVAFLRGLDVERIDFAFLDGSHEQDDVLAEFDLVRSRVVAAGGKIYFDNTSAGGVAEALAEIRRRGDGNLLVFDNCSWWPPGNAIWQP